VPCARMKDGVILRVSKPARMGIDEYEAYCWRIGHSTAVAFSALKSG